MLTDTQLREHLGHNGHECRVRIQRDGHVWRHGAPTPTDRSMDCWHYCGHVDELRREAEVANR